MVASHTLALLGGPGLAEGIRLGSWPVVGEAERAAVMRVLDRGVLSGGSAPEATALQDEFAEYVGARHCLMTHSGTSALQLALAAAGVDAGHEVIVPAYTFVATAMAVLLQGATPVFVDVRGDSGNIDPRLIGAAITPRTRAIMPVHVHGCPADLDEIGAVASKHGLVVVEDAAQAHGATYGGKPVGALFASGGFSLQSSKNLVAGEGGLFVTSDPAGAEVAEQVRNFGLNVRLSESRSFDPKLPLDGDRTLVSRRHGSMYRGNEMAAAFARAQLASLPERTRRCQENAARLSARIAALPGLTPPVVAEGRTSVHHKFRVRFDLKAAEVEGPTPSAFRDVMIEALRAEGIDVVLWQGSPVPEMPLFDPDGVQAGRFSVTRELLASSFVLFSQSRPLIAQTAKAVDVYANCIEKVWQQRHVLRERALERSR